MESFLWLIPFLCEKRRETKRPDEKEDEREHEREDEEKMNREMKRDERKCDFFFRKCFGTLKPAR